MANPQVIVDFVANTAKLQAGVSQVQSTGGKLKTWAKGIAATIGTAFAVQKLTDWTKAAADDAEQQQKLANVIHNVTGATDAQVAATEAYIAKLSQQVAISDDELRPALQNLVVGFGNTADAQRALQLATDISVAKGKDLTTVSEALAKAAKGNTASLGRLGVATKDASGKALSLDEIMSNLSATFGGQAAKSADTAAGRMRGAQVAFGELQETIGAALLPVVQALAPALIGVVNALTALGPALPIVVGGILAVVAAVKAWSIIQLVLNATLWASPITWVVLGIAALVAAIIVVVKNWKKFQAAAAAVFNWFKRNWPLLLAIITGPMGVAILLVTKNWDKLKAAAAAVVNWVKDRFTSLANFFKSLASTVAAVFRRIVDAIKAPLNAVIRGWNAVSFTFPKVSIPSWIPLIGGKSFGGFTIRLPHIPELATGGVLTQPTLFMGGEGPGREIVAPERLLRELLAERPAASYTLNVYPKRADAAELAFGFRRLELLRGGR